MAAARGRLATEERGSVVLRGQSTPVTLHALRGEAGTGAWIPFRAAAPGPLVGRTEELAALTDVHRPVPADRARGHRRGRR